MLIEAFGGPLVAPSANISGHVSPTRAEHVQADLGDKIDLAVTINQATGQITPVQIASGE